MLRYLGRCTGADRWVLLSSVAGVEAESAGGANVQGVYLVATGADGYQPWCRWTTSAC